MIGASLGCCLSSYQVPHRRADREAVAYELAHLGHGEILRADVHAIRPSEEREIGSVVDHQRRSRSMHQGQRLPRYCKELPRAGTLPAELHHGGARPGEAAAELGEWEVRADRWVGDGVESLDSHGRQATWPRGLPASAPIALPVDTLHPLPYFCLSASKGCKHLMSKSIDLKNLDSRLAERMIRNGQLSREDWEKHLESLSDSGEAGEAVETEFETGVLETNE